jgi:hypothetical protein
MVRSRLGDESGAKLIEQRGIDLPPRKVFSRASGRQGQTKRLLLLCARQGILSRLAEQPGSLYQERIIRSVANNTRQDGEGFLRIAAEIPIRTHIESYPIGECNLALNAFKNDAIRGSAVLHISPTP